MVSLPLLFPYAFSTGILKTHAMEGALLFGMYRTLNTHITTNRLPTFRSSWYVSGSLDHIGDNLNSSLIGTGKTLLARAIARESGARMMIIKPSDVMDMVSIQPSTTTRLSHIHPSFYKVRWRGREARSQCFHSRSTTIPGGRLHRRD